MTDLSQLTPDQLQALQAQLGGGSPAPQPYPAAGGYQPNPAQSQTAWGLYNTGGIHPGADAQPGTINYPQFSVPGRPSAPGSYIIDQSGKLRIAGENDDGSPAALRSFSDADLRNLHAQMADSDPGMSTLEDWGRSGITGLQRGVTSLAGLPGDLRGLGAKGLGAAVNAGARALGLPDQSRDVGQFMDTLTGTPGFQMFGPGHQVLDANVQKLAGPYHDPQSVGGHYAQTIGEFAPAALTGGEGLLSRAASVAIPAVASESAGQLTQGMDPRAQAAARIAGGLVGGFGVGAAQGLTRAPLTTMNAFIPGLTDEHVAAAQALRQSAAARGLDLTIPEAVQQVTNNGTGLGRLQRIVESSRHGGAQTAPYFAARPGQVQSAVADYLDTIAPATDQPSMVGVRAQGAATTALDRARQLVNRIAGPDYKALRSQTMDPEQYAEFSGDPSYKIALQALRDHPELGPSVAGLPDSNLAVINAVGKRLGTMADQAKGTPLAPGDNELAGVRIGAKSLADAIARDASPEYDNAKNTVANLSQTFVDPLKAGPVGTISTTPDVASQTGALYPSNPLEGASGETGAAVRVLNNTAPGTADALTRQRLAGALDSSLRDLHGGPNQYAGAKFAVDVAGQPQQQAVLHAGISALPDGAAKSSDLADLLEGLRATGRRQPVGSNTAEKSQDLASLGRSPAVNFLTNFDIAKPLDFLGEAFKGAGARYNAQKLADVIMANPDQTSALLKAAMAATPSNQFLPPAFVNALSGTAGASQ